MSCADLIKEFSTRTTVPVELDDVVEAIKKRGVKDEIYYFMESFDETILAGALVEEDIPDGEGGYKRVASINVAKSRPAEDKRLVACKELLHLLDPEDMRINTEEEFEKLISRMGLPPELQIDVNADGRKTFMDRVGLYKALAVLFPYAARELFLPKFKENPDCYTDIAQVVDIPARFVFLVMQDAWPKLHELLIQEEAG